MALALEGPECLQSLVLNDIGPERSATGGQRIAETFGQGQDGFPSIQAYVEHVVFTYLPNLKDLP